ncbi:C40 family peptidase [Streptomyces griseorubiginosus]|uniref:C40 family peptidase n=1 Tax=Streptomyces griseorubiginosus TaxID=67304 RepID=UPI0011403A3D|nr:C40 family peptidase [Streptomyces griseorubiginosus]
MAPDRTSRNGGFSLPAKRNSALATAAMASAALLSQTGNAAADEAPSRDEVDRRITNLYDRAETDSGTYNATRAAASRASSTRGRTPATSGGSRRSGGEPALEALAKQWYGVGRAKLGPFVEATLPGDRLPAPAAETRRQRPAEAPAARAPKPAEQPVPELTAKPMLALPPAPEQPPMWTPDPAPQPLTGTGETPVVSAPQLETGFPEYSTQTGNGFAEYGTQTGPALPGYGTQGGGQLPTGTPEYATQVATGLPEYTGQLGTGLPEYTGQLTTGLPEYPAQSAAAGFPEPTGQFGTGQFSTAVPGDTGQFSTALGNGTGQFAAPLPDSTGQFSTVVPNGTGQFATPLPDSTGQFSSALPNGTGQFAAPLPGYTPQPTPLADYSTDLGTSLTAVAPAPGIPSPRSPEPQWQAPPQSAAPASLPTADPGYDSKVIQVLAFARSQIGKPCVWGAAGPGSYDNAGLTQAAWRVAGVSLPRTSLGQASTGTAVPLYAMQPGDLVFFHDDFSHVGLCTGNGMMIHAPGPGSSIREESIYPTGESIIRSAIRPA